MLDLLHREEDVDQRNRHSLPDQRIRLLQKQVSGDGLCIPFRYICLVANLKTASVKEI